MDIKRIIRLLEELETSSTTEYGDVACCPDCEAQVKHKNVGGVIQPFIDHAPDCELMAVLTELRKEVANAS